MQNLIKEIDTEYFTFTSVGLTINEATPVDSWLKLGKALSKIDNVTKFWIGDWLNFGKDRYGEMYSQALEDTNYSYGGLANIAFVARNIESSRRRENVDFSIYETLASLKEIEQEKWLDKVEKEGLKRKELRTAIKRSKLILPKLEGSSRVDIKCGDFRDLIKEVEDNSVSLVITDPPYPAEYLPLWGELAKESARILKPGGFLISYSGQKFLPEVFDNLKKYLTYYWILSLYHKGQISQRFEVNMWNRFKPILVYYKEPLNKQFNWIEDVIVSEKPDKDKHEWGQSVEPFIKLIETFSNEGETICDPFFGGGSTIEAALKTKRHIIGYEIDKTNFDLVKRRL